LMSLGIFSSSASTSISVLTSDEGRLVHDIVKLSIKGVSKTPIHYDVFLNHRGKDIKKTFANQLYYRLRNYGLQVFYDQEELQKGNRINSEIENAIKVASIHIAIFSKGYAESEWCMDELALMVESESIIISAFHGVNPTKIWQNPVDGMNGVYAEALRKLKEEKTFDPETHQEKQRYNSNTLEIWEKALKEVTGRVGFELEKYDGDEGQLLDVIVREVKTKVKKDEAKLLTEPCQKNNPSSSERERYQVVGDPDSKGTRRRSSYERKRQFLLLIEDLLFHLKTYFWFFLYILVG